MIVLKFGARLFEDERNLLKIKDVVEATEGRAIIIVPQGSDRQLSDLIPGSQVVQPQTCLAGHPEIFTPYSKKVIVPGIIPDGLAVSELTDLEVGAPDYLASLIAASNDAERLEIWTNMDGFMTADPSSVKTAYLIKEMSYREAMELCNFGVGLIYSPALFPVNSKGIPTVVKNLLNPEGPGTTIKKECPTGERAIRGISSIDNVSLITLSGTSMAGVVGVNCRIFTALALERISAFLVCQSASETGISIGVSSKDAPKAKAVLDGTFAREIENGSLSPMKVKDGLAAVSVIGDNMRNTPGIAGKLFATLGRNGISVSAFAQDASESNISFIVDRSQLRKSLNVIHDGFFLSEYQELNLFLCGIGTVGSRLIAQIQGQRQKLMDEHNLKINVVGIARSVKGVFDRDGIDLDNWRESLENGIPITPAKLRDEVIGMNIFNSVFVDCTASSEIASLYEDFLDRGISVVAANKIAASSDYSVYKRLKDISRQRGVKFLFETNVGAGLPIIGTINDLRNSGDRILKMEAVVSGTLNFIFNNLSADTPFSETVRMAKEQGFSEPDPRMDLSGTDVIRKLVILSREAGYEVNMEDVEANLFIPASFFECSLDEFWAKLPELDAKFEAERKRLQEEGKRWRFVAVNDNGKCSVSLREIPMQHSFYVLDGS
ncbi:MAG: aspartate kinase, partial [Bacteroidales bacterium]|nr:aspartate kinase [Bacteroidales bacterium]